MFELTVDADYCVKFSHQGRDNEGQKDIFQGGRQ